MVDLFEQLADGINVAQFIENNSEILFNKMSNVGHVSELLKESTKWLWNVARFGYEKLLSVAVKRCSVLKKNSEAFI